MYVSIHFYHIELCLIRMISSDKKKYKKQDIEKYFSVKVLILC